MHTYARGKMNFLSWEWHVKILTSKDSVGKWESLGENVIIFFLPVQHTHVAHTELVLQETLGVISAPFTEFSAFLKRRRTKSKGSSGFSEAPSPPHALLSM